MVQYTYVYFDFIIDTHHNVKRSEKSHECYNLYVYTLISSFTQQTVPTWHCTLIHTAYQLSTKHNSSVLNSGCSIFWREVKNMLAKCKYTGKKSCILNNIPRQSECDIGIAPGNNAAATD